MDKKSNIKHTGITLKNRNQYEGSLFYDHDRYFVLLILMFSSASILFVLPYISALDIYKLLELTSLKYDSRINLNTSITFIITPFLIWLYFWIIWFSYRRTVIYAGVTYYLMFFLLNFYGYDFFNILLGTSDIIVVLILLLPLFFMTPILGIFVLIYAYRKGMLRK